MLDDPSVERLHRAVVVLVAPVVGEIRDHVVERLTAAPETCPPSESTDQRTFSVHPGVVSEPAYA
jgi:hypothetical protein